MKNKKLALVVLTAGLSVLSCIPAFAGEWKADTKGWWYREDNGSYPASTWKEINGKQYYFGADGYMLANTTTPDGYTVNGDGAWTVNGVVQEKKKSTSENFIAKTIIEDMGSTYAQLKAKYGDYDQSTYNPGLFYTNVYFNDKFSTLSSSSTGDSTWDDIFRKDYPYYGKQVAFTNSPIKIENAEDTLARNKGALYYPNYMLETDSSWNILPDKTPITMVTKVQDLFPDLPEKFELDTLQEKIEACGGTVVDIKDNESWNPNPWENNAIIGTRTVEVKFSLGGHRCEMWNFSQAYPEEGHCAQPILLSTLIYIYKN